MTSVPSWQAARRMTWPACARSCCASPHASSAFSAGRGAAHCSCATARPVIVLEAQSLASWRWPLALTPEWARELARLRADGHTAQRTRRHWLITPSPDALRCTLLWRTLLHELGHIADHARCLSGKGQEVWKTRCSSAKEDFAHRYAQERMAALQASGQAPFPAKNDSFRLLGNGLRPEWFQPVFSFAAAPERKSCHSD